jgi:type IV secretion system protein TrbC
MTSNVPRSTNCHDLWGRPIRTMILFIFEVVIGYVVLLTNSELAQAAGSGMPWEAPLERILQSVQGPVTKILAVIIITMTGLSLAFGDTSGGFRKMIQVVFGLSIAFAATSFFLSFFSFGGGGVVK